MWPSQCVIGGEVFGPYGTMDINAPTIQPGITLTLQVRHKLGRAVPFRAVMLGKRVTEAQIQRARQLASSNRYHTLVHWPDVDDK